MDIENISIEDRIMELINTGIDLSGEEVYDQAFETHLQAVHLAEEVEGVINPDYYAYANAELAYVIRQSSGDREEAMDILHKTLEETRKAFIIEDIIERSFFGTARLEEEIGLVLRNFPKKDEKYEDLKQASNKMNEAVENYAHASMKPEQEIVDKETIEDHLFRCKGISAMIGLKLAGMSRTLERREYLMLAKNHANSEVFERKQRGEKSGFGYLNSLHTLGAVESEFAAESQTQYQIAKDHLEEAKELAQDLGYPRGENITNAIDFRLVWLEYRRDPSKIDQLGKRLDDIWPALVGTFDRNESIKGFFKDQMMELGENIGGPYRQRIIDLYKE